MLFTKHSSVLHPNGCNSVHCLNPNSLVPARVVSLTVREEVVNYHSDNGEQKDDQAPDELIHQRTIGLEDLNPCDDVEDEDYESDDAASSGALP